MQTPDELNTRFGLAGAVAFDTGEGGLTRATVRTPACTGEAYLHGAHATHWQPAGHAPVLWQSTRAVFAHGKPIRGGVPICFPWFAGHRPQDQPDAPSHGLARTAIWDVVDTACEGGAIAITFATRIAPYGLRYTARFGTTLGLELQATNTSDTDAAFEAALHCYFVISQITQARVTGLSGAAYENTVGGASTRHTQPDTPLAFTSETDAIYATDAACKILDPGLSRVISIEKQGSASTVVWNPWNQKARAMHDFADDEWPGMLCVEPGNITPNGVSLRPGQSHTTAATVGVSAG